MDLSTARRVVIDERSTGKGNGVRQRPRDVDLDELRSGNRERVKRIRQQAAEAERIADQRKRAKQEKRERRSFLNEPDIVPTGEVWLLCETCGGWHRRPSEKLDLLNGGGYLPCGLLNAFHGTYCLSVKYIEVHHMAVVAKGTTRP